MSNIYKIVCLAVVLLIAAMQPAIATDAGTPATYTILYSIPSDTTFTVNPVGAETQLNFTPANKDSDLVEPYSQNAGGNTPWATIDNDGNVEQDFKANLTTAQISWASLEISNYSTFATPITISTTATAPTGWSNVVAGSGVKLFARVNFTNAASGDTTRTLAINTYDST